MEVETQSNTSASETKIDISDIKEHKEEIEKTPSETKDDIFVKTEMHRKSIHQIFVSQCMDYTEYGRSVLEWSVNVENNGPQQPDVYFKVDKKKNRYIFNTNAKLKKSCYYVVRIIVGLIDLNNDRTSSDRFLKLKHQVDYATMAWDSFLMINQKTQFLGNILKLLIIDIEIPESLNGQVESAIYRTKLFLNIVNNSKMFQFDLLTMNMNLERKYHEFTLYSEDQITVNKNQTLLLAIGSGEDTINIYSMENGMLIYKCGKSEYDRRIKFITLKNTERLAICCKNYSKLVDPYQVYEEIDISDDFNNTTSLITKLNKRIFVLQME
ncbi:uncharacterized protein OCT59_019906 [Rhizophagus irregularis]|uniref:Uncharacterized protein n=1 Tax=Rhizophagus irregularis (strain DAOM 197198w) TaxID=1432141 RepID=A0A015LYK5_RHIIW|nr:hypothetical protein RirG_020660 [Rhizophagus irregularis DAOM 197198w]UZO27717.1 hypothetical protein OCT59_019906 [Rhizophagus irregularis]